ncbi:ABC transporter substrate-binding protein [Roseixanthobacter liquoris]|uniref:ABC transporter substrate-binding protein n=1 Tax=Roseixanthobacter liquoris TaxID=3119921 RepID=UPI0037263344
MSSLHARLAAGLLLVASCLPASAQTKVRYLLTSPSPTVAEAPHSSVPETLGFWKSQGLDVEVSPFSGSTAAAQLVIAGTAEFTMASPEALLFGRQDGAKIIAVYNHVREPIYTIAVLKDSGITQLKDLKDKTIGVVSLSSGAVPVAKAMLRSIGFDPEKDVKWLPIGLGAQAAAAIKANRVDALALWDWSYAQLENYGLAFRHFETVETSKLLSLMLLGNEDYVNANPTVAEKMGRGIAMGTQFTLANPEAAVRIHWQKYPASKPTNIPEDQALKEAIHILQARLAKYKVDGRTDPRFGAFTREEWIQTEDFFYNAGLIKSKPDVSTYYTNKFVEYYNAFDKKAIIAQAKDYK